jgi:hypothetical protein
MTIESYVQPGYTPVVGLTIPILEVWKWHNERQTRVQVETRSFAEFGLQPYNGQVCKGLFRSLMHTIQ